MTGTDQYTDLESTYVSSWVELAPASTAVEDKVLFTGAIDLELKLAQENRLFPRINGKQDAYWVL